MTGLVALTARDALSRPRLRTLLEIMPLLLAVLADKWVLALFGAIAGTMAVFLAVHALDGGRIGLVLYKPLSAALDRY